MKNLYFSNREIESDEGRKYKLNYYLLVEDVFGNDGDLILENYGVKVSIESEGKEEKIEIRNITTNALKIHHLIRMLYDNFVTPITVFDVVSDWL